ncbi:MAG TPA: ATP-binding protein [Chloroflexi bacterium]|nr:ATP-binding protein [Chloroflexota bacterium]
MINRQISNRVVALSTKFPVVSITGPRQSGKTTLARACFPEHEYVNLENLDIFRLAQDDPRAFLQLGSRKKMVIDEIQRFPDLFSYIMVEVDEQKIPGQFVITGSQQFALNERITQSLAGRSANLTLLPFSIVELSAADIFLDHYEWMLKGFYPRIYDMDIPPEEYYRGYLFTYVERDLRQIRNIGNLSAFQRFMQLLAGRVGQVVNFSSLGSDVGVDHKTIQSWISVLEASYIVYRLPPYFENFGKRIIRNPKIFFYDTGLLCYLLGVDSVTELSRHFAVGSIFENFIISEVQKSVFNHSSINRLYFWRDKNANEVDLIIDQGIIKRAIEIKLGSTYASSMIKGLKFWQNLLPVEHQDNGLVYTGEMNRMIQDIQLYNWKDFVLHPLGE